MAVRHFLARYPLIAIALAVAGVGLGAEMLGAPLVAQWLVSGLAATVAAIKAWSMVRQMMRGAFGLDVLAVTAIIATLVVGEYWASIIIVLMLAGGEALEDFAAGKAEAELGALLSNVPQIAHRLRADGGTDDIAVALVAVGDRLLVRPSEIVPVDSTLQSESASFDESSLTGESLPVDKTRGDHVMSGSLNGPGAIEVVAQARAEDSQYQRIVELVKGAKDSKAPLVRLADRYAVPFTAIAYVLAIGAWIVSGDSARFAEVLVVATPCPLLIGAPVAFMAGMSSAAKSGIVIKHAGTLERLARASTVAFDKTGTLTHGMPAVVAVHPEGMTDDELLVLVGSAEQYSSHVLAEALRAAVLQRGLVLRDGSNAREIATHGVEATIDGRTVFVGKPKYVAERATGVRHVELRAGEAAVYVAVDNVFAGSIVVRDEIRGDAAATLKALESLSVHRTMMLTGDVDAVAHDVARRLGIDDVHGECLPEDKVAAIRAAQPRPVIMVGDGVNDAPVLAVADVGIAMGARGSTSAAESADVVILLDDISRVARAISIGQRTVAIALQSIWWGIVISVALMIVAAFGFLPAIVGAGLQEVVDLISILGALRAVKAGQANLPGIAGGR
ncbi:heavy metal-(Cd/Co/Hg/Pb/Zn)-translocating P-type ATPase [Microbacteriaceae bacterium MWH-Ta3]|nr:heavy metal-(Cd/Co/Hg/Pb/Zn)-translocating P-type ATPase [Microbacteriaceae bacterium MWH-Ta3]